MIIVGCAEGYCNELTLSLNAQNNKIPSLNLQTYKFKIHAHSRYQWNPHLPEKDFIKILSNITEIKLRGTYSYKGIKLI